MQIARFAIVSLFAFATYLGGAKLVESMQRRQVLRRSAELQMRLRGSRQPWVFESPDRRVHRADSEMATWRLLLLGADDCVSCVRQQSALLETLSQSDTSLLSQVEVWLISDQ